MANEIFREGHEELASYPGGATLTNKGYNFSYREIQGVKKDDGSVWRLSVKLSDEDKEWFDSIVKRAKKRYGKDMAIQVVTIHWEA